MAADIPGLISAIAGALADQPEAIEVTEVSRGRRQIVRLQVASGDMGRVIGRDGRVANAMRTLLVAAGDGTWNLEIGD